MRTDFSINAKQVKRIFPGSWLEPGEDFVFRGLDERDIELLLKVNESQGKERYFESLRKDSRTVFIVAALGERLVGYIEVSILSERTVLEEVRVRKDCREKGVGTSLVIAFFCFALHINAGQIKVLFPEPQIDSILTRLGMKETRKTISLQELAAQLKKSGNVDLSKFR